MAGGNQNGGGATESGMGHLIDSEIARDHGFDISMPDITLAASANVLKDHQTHCRKIYMDFLDNMSEYDKEESQLLKSLEQMNKERKKNTLYVNEQSVEDSERVGSSQSWAITHLQTKTERQSTDKVSTYRPQTAPPGLVTIGNPRHDKRPQTAASEKIMLRISQRNSGDETAGAPKVRSSWIPELDVNGEVDLETERTKARKIVVTPAAFAQLSTGDVRATLKNRTGHFIVRPVNTTFNRLSNDTQIQMSSFHDPSREKIAMVRQVTSYKSPTITNDMKRNNRLYIQRSLLGKLEHSRAVTISEIMENARNRKTRHFRIVTQNAKSVDSDDDDWSPPTRSGPARTSDKTDRRKNPSIKQDQSSYSSGKSPIMDAKSNNERLQHAVNLFCQGVCVRDIISPQPQTPLVPKQSSVEKVSSKSKSSSSSLAVPRLSVKTLSVKSSDLNNNDTKHRSSTRRTSTSIQKSNSQETPSSDNEKDQSGQKSATSFRTMARVVQFVGKLKSSSAANNTENFLARFKSRKDSVSLVKNQIMKDKELEDVQQTWRRRMAFGGTRGKPSIKVKRSSLKAI